MDTNNLSRICRAIDDILASGDRAVIAIDGCCASGKTTLARELSGRYGCEVIHMDDFFLPPDMRTPERYAEPGGNVHYERIIAEVLPGLKSGEPFDYRIFSCSEGRISGTRHIIPGRIVIVEGSYCLHPALRDAYDLRIMLRIDRAEQLRRIRERNGDYAAVFESRWIPLEELYFDRCAVAECCDIVI